MKIAKTVDRVAPYSVEMLMITASSRYMPEVRVVGNASAPSASRRTKWRDRADNLERRDVVNQQDCGNP
jgi:hypothetical protein